MSRACREFGHATFEPEPKFIGTVHDDRRGERTRFGLFRSKGQEEDEGEEEVECLHFGPACAAEPLRVDATSRVDPAANGRADPGRDAVVPTPATEHVG